MAAEISTATDLSHLHAIPPARGEVIHLYQRGYRPATKLRSVQDGSALCGSLVHPPGVPLPRALTWTCRESTPEDPRPPWRWCRSCVGHAVLGMGIADEVLARVVELLQRDATRA